MYSYVWVSVEARKQLWIPWDWDYRQLWAPDVGAEIFTILCKRGKNS